MFLTFKCIQRKVFFGLKALKRKPQFLTLFMAPKYPPGALTIFF